MYIRIALDTIFATHLHTHTQTRPIQEEDDEHVYLPVLVYIRTYAIESHPLWLVTQLDSLLP
jgi:hypothetical protein